MSIVNNVQQILDEVETKAEGLDRDGPIMDALPSRRSEVKELWAGENIGEYWPPLVLYLQRNAQTALRALDQAVVNVRNRSDTRHRRGAVSWLEARSAEASRWTTGFFETTVKAQFLQAESKGMVGKVTFDVELESGRDVDVSTTVGSSQIFIECTSLTDSTEDLAVKRNFELARHADPSIMTWGRPGPFEVSDQSGPDLYFDAGRIFEKVYDKLAREDDPAKSQTHDSRPNALVLSLDVLYGGPPVGGPSAEWAFQDLFAVEPRVHNPQLPVHTRRASLRTFLEDKFGADRVDEFMDLRRRLGALFVFSHGRYETVIVNSTAWPENAVTVEEVAMIEKVLGLPIGF